MTILSGFLQAFWFLLSEMAPYLWLGFAITFFLKWLVPPSWIRKHLGGEGLRPVVLATVAGLPLPLCSCGVLPVAAAIRREGGGRAGVAAFTVSTPQTGVDSILATAGLLGWGLAFLRLGTALLCGLLTGFFVGLMGREKPGAAPADKTPDTCCQSQNGSNAGGGTQTGPNGLSKKIPEATRFAFVRLPADIGLALLVGTLIAAGVVVAAPDWQQMQLPGGVLGSYALVSLMAVPVYVCSTGVIPLAFGLLAAGFPAGAAFILLTAGPSVSATSLLTLGRLIGWRGAVVTALTLLAVSWSVGALLDFSRLGNLVPDCSVHEMMLPWWKQASAAGLLCFLVAARWIDSFRK